MAEQDLPPGVEYTNYLSRATPTPAPTPVATPTTTPVASPTPTPAVQQPGAMAAWLANYKQQQMAAANARASVQSSPQAQLDRVVSILHPEPQQEHPLAATDRLLNRADNLEHQLDRLQQRTNQ